MQLKTYFSYKTVTVVCILDLFTLDVIFFGSSPFRFTDMVSKGKLFYFFRLCYLPESWFYYFIIDTIKMPTPLLHGPQQTVLDPNTAPFNHNKKNCQLEQYVYFPIMSHRRVTEHLIWILNLCLAAVHVPISQHSF